MYIDYILERISSMKVGCRLGIMNSNIIAYADDIVLLAPSVTALQILINEVNELTWKLGLSINKEKTKCMVFKTSKLKSDPNKHFQIDNKDIEYVNTIKYLGFMLQSDLNDYEDINRVLRKFYIEFNCLLRKFSHSGKEVLLYLFKHYCLQFYGAELWMRSNRCISTIKQFSIGYHKAIKKLIGVSSHESNHYACQEACLFTFEHQINKIKISTAFRLMKDPCSFLAKIDNYMCFSSAFYSHVNSILQDKYNVESLLGNDIDALMARIHFTQNHEEQLRSTC